MQLWLIPTLYAAGSIVCSFVLPRLDARYFAHSIDISAASAFDPQDRAAARIEDRQGLGVSHRSGDGDDQPAKRVSRNRREN